MIVKKGGIGDSVDSLPKDQVMSMVGVTWEFMVGMGIYPEF